jgi:hypothetical protein
MDTETLMFDHSCENSAEQGINCFIYYLSETEAT